MPAALVPDAAATAGLGFVVAMAAAVLLWSCPARWSAPAGPKHLLMAIVIAFHLAVFGLLDHLLPILATLTIFHNLQYHRIVWQYERGLGRTPSGSLARYLASGLALGLVWYGAAGPRRRGRPPTLTATFSWASAGASRFITTWSTAASGACALARGRAGARRGRRRVMI